MQFYRRLMESSGIEMSQRELLDEEHVVRHCSRQKQIRDQNEVLIGVSPAAFELRRERNETYLSATWLEHCGAASPANLRGVKQLLIASGFDLAPKTALVACNAGRIRGCGSERSAKLRVRHEPSRSNPAYSAIRGLPLDNSDLRLLQLLATVSVVACVEVRQL